MRYMMIVALGIGLAACNSGDSNDAAQDVADTANAEATIETAAPKPLHMVKLDCGTIEISDLDNFSTEGDYAGTEDVFTDTCWLIHHPNGILLWDLGLPSPLAGAAPQTSDIFTVSLEQTITDQLTQFNLTGTDVDYISISHQHFDHIGQVDQFQDALWLVHEDEYASMFPPLDEAETDEGAPEANPYSGFADLARETFTGEKDVFGDGSVIIFETLGHTPGHTSLQVNLPETGPVLLTGDLYHRAESRELRRVPRFNWDVATPPDGTESGSVTQASMDTFEARAASLGALVIIQHDSETTDPLPSPPEAMK